MGHRLMRLCAHESMGNRVLSRAAAAGTRALYFFSESLLAARRLKVAASIVTERPS
jgi:hypothetical protein